MLTHTVIAREMMDPIVQKCRKCLDESLEILE